MRTLIKICGITNINDAEIALEAGADALGFVFYRKSSRYVTPETTRTICKSIPDTVLKVGVFVNEEIESVEEMFSENFLDYFQFHGNETGEYCRKFSGKIIKSFQVGRSFNKEIITGYNMADMLLFDTAVKGIHGGTGKTFNWELLCSIPNEIRFVLAGGLNPDNVIDAIRSVRP
ncbi:MAG: phosphoribosylanthranilate isomerase, partial [bacterium]|nr:phosphoribosylanthranilate isomerase [bacterium]